MSRVDTYKCDLCSLTMSAIKVMCGFEIGEDNKTVRAVSVSGTDFHLCSDCIKQIRKLTDPETAIGKVLL